MERRNAVFQDRLVKEMRLRNISSIAQANALLEGGFLDDLNRRYAIDPKRQQDLHRPIDEQQQTNLSEVLCVQEPRVVGQDWCVRWRNRWLQIDRQHAALRLAGKRVLVKQLVDGGTLIVQYKEQRLICQELNQRPPKATRTKKPVVNNRRWKPAANHPWHERPGAAGRSSGQARSGYAGASLPRGKAKTG